MKTSANVLLAGTCLTLLSLCTTATAGDVTIATVNNSDMIRMQRLSKTFEEQHPDIKLKWVVLEENVLRQRLTTDIATKGGQFDVLTIGMYEASLWGAKGWLKEMNDLPASYALDDVFPSVRDGLSVDGKLFALPFYAESSITYYRKDLFNADFRIRRQAHRQVQGTVRHLPARQGRLGREHGPDHHHRQLVRGTLVRRAVEAAIRPA
jgi:sorbitol/mannitol transport system substrate-binding protein